MLAPITDTLHRDVHMPYAYTMKSSYTDKSKVGKPSALSNDVPHFGHDGHDSYARAERGAFRMCDTTPWSSRKPQVYFRGACTGPNYGYLPHMWKLYNRMRYA